MCSLLLNCKQQSDTANKYSRVFFAYLTMICDRLFSLFPHLFYRKPRVLVVSKGFVVVVVLVLVAVVLVVLDAPFKMLESGRNTCGL